MDRISGCGPRVVPVLVYSCIARSEYRVPVRSRKKLATKGAKSTIYLYGRKDYRQSHLRRSPDTEEVSRAQGAAQGSGRHRVGADFHQRAALQVRELQRRARSAPVHDGGRLFFQDPATTDIYSLTLYDAHRLLPVA